MWIVIIVAFVLWIVFYVIPEAENEKAREIVLANSEKIKELRKLYNSMNFHKTIDKIQIERHYDNKSNYNNIEPAYLMSSDIRSKMDYYSDLIHKIQENREKEKVYIAKVSEINQKNYQIDYKALGISVEKFLEQEELIIRSEEFSKHTNCVVYVKMTYSSPQKQVNLSKSASFNFDQIVTSFNSVSRSHLDKTTYNALSKAERGEVSDSLRYDVMNRDKFRCVICGASADEGVRLHIDHIVPISKGGKSTPDNLRTLCERCNIGKSNKIETRGSNTPNNANAQKNTNAHKNSNTQKTTDIPCPRCNGKLVVRVSQFGEFYGCSNYPNCRFTKNIPR